MDEFRKSYLLAKAKNLLWEYTTVDTETILKNIIEYLIEILADTVENEDELTEKLNKIEEIVKDLQSDVDNIYNKF